MVEVIAGSVDSFGELYDRYCDRAYRVARAVCRDDGRAQEAVRDGFLSAWKGRASYRSQHGPVAAWLLMVVRHRAIDLARTDGQHALRQDRENQLETHPAADGPWETAARRDEARPLLASLAMLPDAQAEAITLAYYGQLSHTEIAARLGLPSRAIKDQMRLGLEKLGADLKHAAA